MERLERAVARTAGPPPRRGGAPRTASVSRETSADGRGRLRSSTRRSVERDLAGGPRPRVTPWPDGRTCAGGRPPLRPATAGGGHRRMFHVKHPVGTAGSPERTSTVGRLVAGPDPDGPSRGQLAGGRPGRVGTSDRACRATASAPDEPLGTRGRGSPLMAADRRAGGPARDGRRRVDALRARLRRLARRSGRERGAHGRSPEHHRRAACPGSRVAPGRPRSRLRLQRRSAWAGASAREPGTAVAPHRPARPTGGRLARSREDPGAGCGPTAVGDERGRRAGSRGARGRPARDVDGRVTRAASPATRDGGRRQPVRFPGAPPPVGRRCAPTTRPPGWPATQPAAPSTGYPPPRARSLRRPPRP